MRKTKFILGIISACIFSVMASLVCVDAINTMAADEIAIAKNCTFIIPPTFVPGEEKGLFINENSPMESSTVRYSVYDNGLDKVMTNREKKELEASGAVQIVDESGKLTKDIYQQQLADAYTREYGQDVGFVVSSFDNIDIDGFPGYRIESSYQAQEEEVIHQTVYMIRSRYRVFTVTFQRAEDDDCQELFDNCAQTIHVN